jgi:Rrf2 family protein
MISIKLTDTAEYALRAMSALALLPIGQSLSALHLSEKTRVPVHYLSKIMRRLVESQLVESSKGHAGGFKLARKPSLITYENILEAVGYEKPISNCVFGWGKCRDSKPCPMHGSWTQLNKLFVDWAGNTTLNHIVKYSSDMGIESPEFG